MLGYRQFVSRRPHARRASWLGSLWHGVEAAFGNASRPRFLTSPSSFPAARTMETLESRLQLATVSQENLASYWKDGGYSIKDDSEVVIASGTSIRVGPDGVTPAGSITIQAPSITINSGVLLATSGGAILLDGQQVRDVFDRGTLATRGGSVTIQQDVTIDSNCAALDATGQCIGLAVEAGDITVQAPHIQIATGTRISAVGAGGDEEPEADGAIAITAQNTVMRFDLSLFNQIENVVAALTDGLKTDISIDTGVDIEGGTVRVTATSGNPYPPLGSASDYLQLVLGEALPHLINAFGNKFPALFGMPGVVQVWKPTANIHLGATITSTGEFTEDDESPSDDTMEGFGTWVQSYAQSIALGKAMWKYNTDASMHVAGGYIYTDTAATVTVPSQASIESASGILVKSLVANVVSLRVGTKQSKNIQTTKKNLNLGLGFTQLNTVSTVDLLENSSLESIAGKVQVLAIAVDKNKAKVASVAFRDGTVGLAGAYVESNAVVKVTAAGSISSGFAGDEIQSPDLSFNPAFVVDFAENVLSFAEPVPFKTGDRLFFSSDDGIGTIPGLVPGQSYYAITNVNPVVDDWSSLVSLKDNQLQLALTPADAQASRAVSFGPGYPTLRTNPADPASAISVPVTLVDAEQSDSLMFSYTTAPGSDSPLFKTGDTVSFTPVAGRFLGYNDALGNLAGPLVGNYRVQVIDSLEPELFPLAIQLLDQNGHVVPLNAYSRFEDSQRRAYSVYSADVESGEFWLYPPPTDDTGAPPVVPELPIANGDPLTFHGGLINDVSNLGEAQTYYAIVDPLTPGIIRLAATPEQAAASNPAMQEAVPELLTVANQAFIASATSAFNGGEALQVETSADGSYRIWSEAKAGTFTLTVSAPSGTVTTGPFAHDASAATIEQALSAIAGLVPTVSGDGTTGSPWVMASKYQLEIGAFQGEGQLVFDDNPSLLDGAAVIYQGVPGKPVGGLTDGQVYYAWNQVNPDLVPETPEYVLTLSESADSATPAVSYSLTATMTTADGTTYPITGVLPENGQIELDLVEDAIVTAVDGSELIQGTTSVSVVPVGSIQYFSSADSGTFTFIVTQDGVSYGTAPLAWNATATEVESALNALTNVSVQVYGTGVYTDPWTILGLAFDAITSDSSQLMNGGTQRPLFKQQTPELSAVRVEALGGVFVLELEAGGQTLRTDRIPLDAERGELVDALNALPGVQASVTGEGTAESPWMVTAGFMTLQPGEALVFHDSWGQAPMGLIDGQTYYLASADQLIPQYALVTVSASQADAALDPPALVDLQAFVPLEASSGAMISAECKLSLTLSSGQGVVLIAILNSSDTSHIHTARMPLPSGKHADGHKDPMPDVHVDEVSSDLASVVGSESVIANGGSLLGGGSLGSRLEHDPGAGGNRQNLTDIAASPAVVKVKNDIGVFVAGTARIRASASVMVRSKLEEMAHGMSAATITKPKANLDDGTKGSDKAVALGLNLVLLDNTSQSLIAPNAQVSSGSGVRVDSAIEYPFVMRETQFLSKLLSDESDPTWPEKETTRKQEVWKNTFTSFKIFRNLFLKHGLGVGEWLFNYVSNAGTAAKSGHGEQDKRLMDWAITGSISVVDVKNTNLAQIADGAQINQDPTVPAKLVQGVTLLAETLMTQTGLAGSVLPHLSVPGVLHAIHGGIGELFRMNGGGTANATGGSVFWMNLENSTRALLGGEVAAVGFTAAPAAPGSTTNVNFGSGWGADDPYFPKGLWVEANTDVATFLVAEAGAAAAGFGLEGSFAYLGMGTDDPKSRRQVTHAILSAANRPLLLRGRANTNGDVEVKAADDRRIWLVSGSLLSGAPRGIGLSGAVVELGRDLLAGIGTGNLADSPVSQSVFNFLGNVSIEATADGIVVPASLVGAYAPNHTKRAEGLGEMPGVGAENAASSMEGHWGLDASGDFSGAFLSDHVNAWLVDEGTLSGATGGPLKELRVVSENKTGTHAASGSASLVLESGDGGTTVGASGSAATIVHDSTVESRVANVTLANFEVAVVAENKKLAGSFSGGMQVAVVTGIDVNVAGSVAVNKITNITHAILESVTATLLGETVVEAVSADEVWSAAGMVTVAWDRRSVGGGQGFEPKTMVGVGASAAVNELTNDTLSTIVDSSVEVEEGACEVVADDFTRSFVLTAGTDLSVASGTSVVIGGMFATTVMRPSTQAIVSGSEIRNESEEAGEDLEVAATLVPVLTAVSGYVSIQWGKILEIKDASAIGVGVGAAVVITKVESDGDNPAQTVARIEDSEVEWNAGAVEVRAYSGRWTEELAGNPNVPSQTDADSNSFFALAIAGSAQGEHGAVSVGVTVVGAVVETTLAVSTLASVAVSAEEQGTSIFANQLRVEAEESFDSELDAGGATLAQQGAPETATSVGVAIGGAWNGWTSTSQIRAEVVADAAKGQEPTFAVEQLEVLSTLSTVVDMMSFGVAVDVGYAAGLSFGASLSGATMLLSVTDQVTASLMGGWTVSGGEVTVSAVDESRQTLHGGAGSLSVQVGAGVTVGLAPSAVWANATVANTVTAQIGSDADGGVPTFVYAEEAVLVQAVNAQVVETLVTAVAVTVAVSSQSVALSGSGAESTIIAGNRVTARLGSGTTLTTTADTPGEAAVTVSAVDEAEWNATVGSGAFVFSWYGGSIGVSLAEVEVSDVVQAVVDGSTILTSGGDVAITAEGRNTVDVLSVPTSLAITLGLGIAGGNANITDTSTFQALVTNGSSIDTRPATGEPGELVVEATGQQSLTANISGGAGGLGSVGGFVSDLRRDGSTTAVIEEIQSLQVGSLSLQALAKHTLETTGYVVTIGGLVGTGEKHTLNYGETVEARLSGDAGSTANLAGNAVISAECATTALSEDNGALSIAGLAGGGYVSDSYYTPTIAVSIDALDLDIEGRLVVSATADGSNEARAIAGSGGGVTGEASLVTMETSPKVTLSVGDSAITAADITLSSQSQMDYDAYADSIMAAFVGFSGAVIEHTANPTATLDLNSGTQLKAIYGGVSVLSELELRRVAGSDDHDEVMVRLGAGGAAGAYGGGIDSTFAPKSNVSMDDGVTIQSQGDLVVVATQQLAMEEIASLNTGGLVAGSKTNATITATPDAAVRIGQNVNLRSGGDIGVGTVVNAQANAVALSSMWGLASGGGSESHADFTVDQTVDVAAGTQIEAAGDVRLQAGVDPRSNTTTYMSVMALSVSTSKGLIVIPVANGDASMKASASLSLASSSSTAGGGDVFLVANPGNNDSYEYIQTRWDGLLGDITSQAGTLDNSSDAAINGKVRAGNFAHLDIEVVPAAADGAAPTLTVNGSSHGLNGPIEDTTDTGDAFAPFSATYSDSYLPDLSGLAPATAALMATSVSSSPVTEITLADLSAVGGQVVVIADTLTGSGSLQAAVPLVTINNPTAAYLNLEGIEVGGGPTVGQVVLHKNSGQALSRPATLAVLPNATGVSTAAVVVAQTYGAAVGQGTTSGPAILVSGPISNAIGSVTLSNTKGAVVEIAPINAVSIAISSPNSAFILNTPDDYFGVAGNSQSAWDSTVQPWSSTSVTNSSYVPNYANPGRAFMPGRTATGIDPNLVATAAVDYLYNATAAANGPGSRTLKSTTNSLDAFAQNVLYLDGYSKVKNPSKNDHAQETSVIAFGNSIPYWNTGRKNSITWNATDTHSRAISDTTSGSGGFLQNSFYQFGNLHDDTGADNGGLPYVLPDQPIFASAPLSAVTSKLTGGLTAAQVSITARTIDINGPLNVGSSNNFEIEFPESLASTLATVRGNYQAGKSTSAVYTIDLGPAASEFTATYDAAANQITLHPIATTAAHVSALLTGQVISTMAQASINMIGGPGVGSIVNATGIPLVIEGIDSGSVEVTGTVEIRDTLQNQTTRYEYQPGEPVQVYRVSGTSPTDYGTPTTSDDLVQTYTPPTGLLQYDQYRMSVKRTLGFTSSGYTSDSYSSVAWTGAGDGLWNLTPIVDEPVTDFLDFKTVNAVISADNQTVTLTNPDVSPAISVSAAWLNSMVYADSMFDIEFTYQAAGNKAADGIAFVFQNQGIGALGNTGGALGYVGIPGTTAAYEMNLYAPNGTGTNFVTSNREGTYQSTGSVNIASGNPIHVRLLYDPRALTFTEYLTEVPETGPTHSFSRSYADVNLLSLFGGSPLQIGFTGAYGGATSIQTVTDLNVTVTPQSGLTTASAAGVTLPGTDGFLQYLTAEETGHVQVKYEFDWHGSGPPWGMGDNTPWVYQYPTGYNLAVYQYVKADNPISISFESMRPGDFSIAANSDLVIDGLIRNAGSVSLVAEGNIRQTQRGAIVAQGDVELIVESAGGALGQATLPISVQSVLGSLTAMAPGGIYVDSPGPLTINNVSAVPVTIAGFTAGEAEWSLVSGDVENDPPVTNFTEFTAVQAAISADQRTITLTSPTASPAISVSAAWLDQKVYPDSQIDIQFTYQAAGNRTADGIAFVFQQQGTAAIGGSGGSLGYKGITGTTAAYEMNLYANNGVGTNFVTTNAVGGYQPTGDVNIASGNPIQVRLLYDPRALTLTEYLTEVPSSGPVDRFSRTYTNVDLASLFGNTPFYVGFTGSYGGATSIQAVTDFQMTVLPGTPHGLLSGFSGFATTTAGMLSPGNGTLTLTNDQPLAANAAWYGQRVSTSSFVVNFQYQASGNRAADGAAFVLQKAGTTVVGGNGGNLGYTGIPGQTVAYQMNLYGGHVVGTNFVTSGYAGTYLPTGAVDIASGDPVDVELVYDALAQTLTETLTQGANRYVHTYTHVDLGRLLGDEAYVGFTGATGAATSTQTITNFRFQSVVPELFGNSLLAIPTSGVPNQASAAWHKEPVSVDRDFYVGFVYQVRSDNPADGLALVFQNQGLTAIGGVIDGQFQGNSLGYAGIPGPSAAYEINVFGGNANYPRGSAVATNGQIGPYSATGLVDFSAGHPVQVDLFYNAATGTLTESLVDLATGATYRADHAMQLSEVLGSDTALIGFTAANGAAFSKQLVSRFLFAYETESIADVVLSADGPIRAQDSASLVQGQNITITTTSGVGNSDNRLAVRLDSETLVTGAELGGVINVQAGTDVYLVQPHGDMRLGRIVSQSGAVQIETLAGSIENGLVPDAAGLNSSSLSRSNRDKILARLTSSSSEAAASTVIAYEGMINRSYFDYWNLEPYGTVEDGVFVVDSDAIAILEPQAAQVLGVDTATDQQVQGWANTTWQNAVTAFANDLAFGPNWSSQPQFVAFDSTYVYSAPPSTEAQLTANSESLGSMLAMLSLEALKAENASADEADVNVRGAGVTLRSSGSIGRHETPTFIPLERLDAGDLSEHEKELIAVASQAGELRMVGIDATTGETVEYDYLDPPEGVTPTGVMVYLSRAVRTDLVSGGTLAAEARQGALLVTEVTGDLVIDQASSSEMVLLLADGDLLRSTSGASLPIRGTDFWLTAGGDIGSATTPFLIASSGPVRALATGDVFLNSSGGDLSLEQIQASGNVSLAADGSILNGVADGRPNVIGNDLALTSRQGGIGSSARPVLVTLVGALTATAVQSIYVNSVDSDLQVYQVVSSSGDVVLDPPGDLHSLILLENARVLAVQGDVTLQAQQDVTLPASSRVQGRQILVQGGHGVAEGVRPHSSITLAGHLVAEAIRVLGGPGNDLVKFGSDSTEAGSLERFLGNLTYEGGGGADSFFLDDRAARDALGQALEAGYHLTRDGIYNDAQADKAERVFSKLTFDDSVLGIYLLGSSALGLYRVAPGGMGEVSVELRNAIVTLDRDPGGPFRVRFHDVRPRAFVELEETYAGLVDDADGSGHLSVGDSVQFSVKVTNPSQLRLFNLSVLDALKGEETLVGDADSLAPGASTTHTVHYTLKAEDLDRGSVIHRAIVRATALGGVPVTAEGSVLVPVVQHPSVDLRKTWVGIAIDADASGTISVGDTLEYSLSVTNSGDVTLTSVVVTDALAIVERAASGIETLAPGHTAMYSARYVVTQADADAGQILNSASVTAQSLAGNSASDTDSVTVLVPAMPGLVLNKTVTLTHDVGQVGVSMNDTLTYQFELINVGNQTLDTLRIEDSLPGLGSLVIPVTTLAPGASTLATATYVVTKADAERGFIRNLATALANPPARDPGMLVQAVDDSDIATLAVLAPGAGCSANFWRLDAERHAADAWPAGYGPEQNLSTIFANGDGISLLPMLRVQGEGVNRLLQQGVAAVLNSAHTDLDYPLTTQQVIDAVNTTRAAGNAAAVDALADQLAGYNALGCGVDVNQDPVDPLPRIYGDATMDGVFDSVDLVHLFQLSQYEDALDSNSHWGSGDWDGDGDFTSSDFVLAFQQGLYEAPPAVDRIDAE